MINGGDAKRIIRMVESQPDDLFYAEVMAAPDVIRHPEAFNDWCRGILTKGSKEQQGANYGPRIEGHHPVSVSSSHAAAQHLPIRKAGQFIDGLYEDGVPVGTRAEHMVPLSKNAHTGNAPIAAHVNPVSGMIDEGVWQGAFKGTEYGDDIAALTEAFREQSAEPQIRLAEIASMQPQERELQQAVADAAGVRTQSLMISGGGGPKTEANRIKAQLAKEKFDMQGAAADIFGKDPAARGGAKTSNSSFLTEDRPDAEVLRRDNGLGGNEVFAQDPSGRWEMQLRANNPRRRM